MSYSNSGGGTLTLPSPTHVHHVDVTSAVRSLRRSLSRSPSKFRLVTKSPSSSPKSPLSPSPPKRASSTPTIFTASNSPHTPSPLAVPFPPSAKLALRSSTRSKTAPARPSSRARTSPKSPMKRALSQASDSGNAPPSSSAGSVGGQENSGSTSPAERKSFERSTKMQFNPEVAGPINHALSRLGGDGSNDFPSTTSSPLKRSDAIMNLDQASLGSPVAKRRSLHGSASFGHDFNIFDHGPSSSPSFDIHDEANHEYELSTASLAPLAPENSSSYTSMPRRSSSLRKSTLQQRHGEKTSWGRRHAAQVLAAQQLAQTAPEVSTPTTSKTRPRLSLDQFMPPMARDSPFSGQGSLPNASMHVVNQPIHQPHPLSRTMTTSSSSSSIVDDSPTHVPPHFGEQPRPKLDFSKSLPAGSLRPFAFESVSREDKSFATPQNYKAVKPLPAAFMSTGLISKVNRNPEQPPVHHGSSKAVPDTPCKKHFNGFATYPAPVPGSAIAKARHVRHSFGTPSTPFNPHGSQAAPGTFGKGTGVFGSSYGKGLTRRGSFISVDGYESGGSPDTKGDSQASADFDLPPTPTKQALVQQQNNGSPSSHRSFPASMSAIGYGLTKKLTRTSSKLNLFTSPCDREAEDSDGSMDMDDSPTTANPWPSLRPSESVPSFGKSRALRDPHLQSPTPLLPRSLTTASFLSPSRPGFAKISHVAPASPLERIDFIERLSPRTPQDSMLPPDPSGLSISNPRDGNAVKQGLNASMPPPATPTAGRDYFSKIEDRRNSTTPVSTFAPAEIDHSLLSRFEKVETIGSGEFSQVYRVTQNSSALFNKTQTFFSKQSGSPSQERTPPTPMPERVFAVKKSRQPFQGTRDRQRKLQEVNVLKALGQSDHVVHLIDSWEEKNHLYIQTEFCEEGTLDLFLTDVGRRGKLDVFRIWKVLLEVSQGMKHIHDSGFIHLDLKPANIFITFEGVLKIGDFGMASPWPAPAGIEAEGDRDYIAPEILLGKCDKPADVFALGIIMFEIAGNVKLPENGPSWLKLRRGDTSDVASLTFSESILVRDATGLPIDESDITMESFCSDDEVETDFGSPTLSSRKRNATSSRSLSHDPGNLFGSMRRGELHQPPAFMVDTYHPDALDQLVQAMLRGQPEERPLIHQVLDAQGVRWVDARRRAGATVFEGEWGPADDILAHDSEMIDV